MKLPYGQTHSIRCQSRKEVDTRTYRSMGQTAVAEYKVLATTYSILESGVETYGYVGYPEIDAKQKVN